jgi:two-component system sensor histidine kinase BarA
MDFVGANQSGTEFSPQLKILVVDDDVLSQRMMRVLLTREGHTVDTVSSGLEALNLIKVQKYDVVFMDLQMPGMDGIESTHLIRQWESGNQHTFIVALTASYLPERGHVLFEAGIDNYISKPFELEHIQRLLNYSIKAGLTPVQGKSVIMKTEPASEEVLDVRKGIEQVGGDVDTYRELLRDFVTELPMRLQAIQHSFASMDLVSLSRAAHNLHGVAANLGALQLSECTRKLDKQSAEGYTESIAQLLQEIQLVVSKLLEISNNFLAEKKINVESV